MSEFKKRGDNIRMIAKALVLEFMKATPSCHQKQEGMKQSQLFRECGFDWGEYNNSTSSNQQYWVVALIRELELEGQVERVSKSGPWRLR